MANSTVCEEITATNPKPQCAKKFKVHMNTKGGCKPPKMSDGQLAWLKKDGIMFQFTQYEGVFSSVGVGHKDGKVYTINDKCEVEEIKKIEKSLVFGGVVSFSVPIDGMNSVVNPSNGDNTVRDLEKSITYTVADNPILATTGKKINGLCIGNSSYYLSRSVQAPDYLVQGGLYVKINNTDVKSIGDGYMLQGGVHGSLDSNGTFSFTTNGENVTIEAGWEYRFEGISSAGDIVGVDLAEISIIFVRGD